MGITQALEQYWQSHQFPTKDKTILVAVSGGKDSMALAYLLLQSGRKIAIAHCNFQLRGEASDLDEQLVKDWAQSNNLVLHVIRFDTEKEMVSRKMGIQETARLLRYDWFDQLCQQHNYAAIATAHHANDNAETLMINLCKGTGIAGLHGIQATNGKIIRPFLFALRDEIDQLVTTQRIPYREDASNSSTKYLRNAVRHKILPALNEIFPQVVERLNENINRISQVEIIYLQAIKEEKKKLIEKRGADDYIPILKLVKRPAYESICYEIFSEYGFSSAQIPEILKLLQSESGHYVSSSTHRVIRDRMFLIITRNAVDKTDLILVDYFPQTIETDEGRFIFSVEEVNIKSDNEPGNAYIDFDQLSMPIVLRRRRAGDYFYPLGMSMKKKKLSRFLIDQKIPLHLKEHVWVIENKMKIVWIAGMRLDERFKISNKTKKMLQIKFLLK